MNIGLIPNELFCTFRTELGDEYRVPLSKVNVQSTYTHDDLNMIIKKLLESLRKKSDKQFDFILGGEIIKGNLKSHILRLALPAETNLEIQYFESFGRPDIAGSFKDQNWINKLFFLESKITRLISYFKLHFRKLCDNFGTCCVEGNS
jgi:hypothetical protein